MITGGTLPSNVSLSFGLDAEKPENPKEGEVYVSTDTKLTYVCYEAGTWDNIFDSKQFVTGNEGVQYLDDLGSIVWHSHDATQSTTASSYTKIKEITLTKVPSSTLTIYYESSAVSDGGQRVFTNIYRNGEAVGTERTRWNTGWGTYTETIDGWQDGDKLQIYGYQNVAPRCDVRYLRILCTPTTNNSK